MYFDKTESGKTRRVTVFLGWLVATDTLAQDSNLKGVVSLWVPGRLSRATGTPSLQASALSRAQATLPCNAPFVRGVPGTASEGTDGRHVMDRRC